MSRFCSTLRSSNLAALAFACWLAASQQGAFGSVVGAWSQRSEHQQADTDSLLDHVVVVPEHRLLFCAIDGAEAERFNSLFRHIRSEYDATQTKGSNMLRNAYWTSGLSEEGLRKLFQDETWHKAVFVREPIERFITMYNNSCGGTHDVAHAQPSCKALFGVPPTSLPQAVNRLRTNLDFDPNTVLDESNTQLMLQTNFCGGLHKYVGKYNTVMQLRPQTANRDVEKMLTQVGVPSHLFKEKLDRLFPVDGKPAEELRKWFPEEHASWMLHTMLARYGRDYQDLHITVPHWVDAMIGEDGKGLPSWLHQQRILEQVSKARAVRTAAAAAAAKGQRTFGVNSTLEEELFAAQRIDPLNDTVGLNDTMPLNESFIAEFDDDAIDAEAPMGEVTGVVTFLRE